MAGANGVRADRLNARPAVRTGNDSETHRICCPHCPVGSALTQIAVNRNTGRVDIDRTTILVCDSCRRPFSLGIRVLVVGQPLADVGGPARLPFDTIAPDLKRLREQGF